MNAIVKVHNPASYAAGVCKNEAQFGAALKHLPPSETEPDAPPNRLQVLTDALTLTEFFDRWFLPVVLVANERCTHTADRYREMLKWWTLLTLDPPIRDIDDRLVAGFVGALKLATYRRGPDRDEIPLARHTICEHIQRLATMLGRMGSQAPRGGAVARLVKYAPAVPRLTATKRVKPCFTLDEARAIAAAAERMERPKVADMTAAKWWRAWIGLAFYTGLRVGTIRQLRWRHIVQIGGQQYLDIPATVVKTRKPLHIAVHPQLAAVLKLRYHKTRDHLILPDAGLHRTLLDWHQKLQRFAGLKGAMILSPHGWRRTHGQMLAELGLSNAEELARAALDHSSSKVTTDSYISVVDQFRLRLPDLWPGGLSAEHQLPLF